MYVGVDSPSSENHTFSSYCLSTGADDNIYIVLNIRISSFADLEDVTIFDPDIGFDNTPPVKDQGIGNY